MSIRVKICGIKSRQEATDAIRAGTHGLGFNFIKGSKRYINPELARDIILTLPPFVTIVGVFADEPRYNVEEIASLCKLHVLQFHGQEPPEYCKRWSYPIIKAFRVDTSNLQEPNGDSCAVTPEHLAGLLETYPVNALLLDTFQSGMIGGSGQPFDWSAIKNIALNKPVILAGGLQPTNVKEAIRIMKPYGVDVASGVELDGQKNYELMASFVQNASNI